MLFSCSHHAVSRTLAVGSTKLYGRFQNEHWLGKLGKRPIWGRGEAGCAPLQVRMRGPGWRWGSRPRRAGVAQLFHCSQHLLLGQWVTMIRLQTHVCVGGIFIDEWMLSLTAVPGLSLLSTVLCCLLVLQIYMRQRATVCPITFLLFSCCHSRLPGTTMSSTQSSPVLDPVHLEI